VSDALTYTGALTILGGQGQSRLVSLVDAAATVGFTAWAAGAVATGNDPGPPLSLIDLKDDIVTYSRAIVRKVAEWRRGLSRFDRSQRLAAAHAVIVVSSFFEVLERADLPVPLERLGFTAAEKVSLAIGDGPPASYADLIGLLIREPIPLPEPHRPSTEVYGQLLTFYGRLSDRLAAFVSGLEVWDQIDDAQRRQLDEAIRSRPTRAMARYQEAYRELATDNREFEVWAAMTQAQALGVSLSRVTSMLQEMASQRPGSRPRVHLSRAYEAALGEPIGGAGQAPEGLVLPSLGEAYVNPRCRIAEIRPGDAPASAEWWSGQEVVPDIESFLAGYLTSPRAVRSPLVILGEPGSGKSTLTEVLAARLPAEDFLPVLVPLREVAAESMIQEQIEQAIYKGPGDRVSWHDLLEPPDGTLPVVLLDGFDELVQATALNRYDYLEQVCDFQQRQAQIGHPVAVVVTSRMVLADRVRFPLGSIAAQLQPFDETQVRRWLDVWAHRNSSTLAERGLRPLPAETALDHGELAEQPLLLLMLAIFDTSSNALQREGARIGRAELYERLMSDFALREVLKSPRDRSRSAEEQQGLAEREVQRIAAVAVAMFARGRQVVTEAELDRDLPVIFPEDDAEESADAMAPSPAQRATGRFFFIYKDEGRSRGARVRSYEFLHSTFGEFLVARNVISALTSLAEVRGAIRRAPTRAGGRLDDGMLYAPLSFSYLAGRAAIVGFLREQLQKLPDEIRASFGEMLPELIGGSLFPHLNRSLQDYEPVREPVTRRLAVYSANLVLLLVLVAGELDASELSGGVSPAEKWRQYGFLWRGGLTAAEWRALIETIRVRVHRKDGRVDIRLALEDGSPVSPLDSVLITNSIAEHEVTHYDLILSTDNSVSYEAAFPASSHAGRIFRDIAFLPGWHTGMLLLQSLQTLRALNGEVRWQSTDGAGILPGYLLATLDFARDRPPEERIRLYEHALYRLRQIPDNPALYEELMLRLKYDAYTFSVPSVIKILGRLRWPTPTAISIINELWSRSRSHYSQELISLVCRFLAHTASGHIEDSTIFSMEYIADKLPGLDESIAIQVNRNDSGEHGTD
jgi:NACHT N-terminal Helical domain 7